MGIYHEPLVDIKTVTQHDIGGLATHTGESGELVDGARDLAAVVFNQCLGTADDILGLVLVKSSGTDDFFHLPLIRLSKLFRSREALKQVRGDHVDPHVRALGGQDGGDQELKGGFVVQFAMGIGELVP